MRIQVTIGHELKRHMRPQDQRAIFNACLDYVKTDISMNLTACEFTVDMDDEDEIGVWYVEHTLADKRPRIRLDLHEQEVVHKYRLSEDPGPMVVSAR